MTDGAEQVHYVRVFWVQIKKDKGQGSGTTSAEAMASTTDNLDAGESGPSITNLLSWYASPPSHGPGSGTTTSPTTSPTLGWGWGDDGVPSENVFPVDGSDPDADLSEFDYLKTQDQA